MISLRLATLAVHGRAASAAISLRPAQFYARCERASLVRQRLFSSSPARLAAAQGQSTKPGTTWKPISIGAGVAILALFHLIHKEKSEKRRVAQQTGVSVEGSLLIHAYSLLPLRLISRAWGWLNGLTVPMILREPLYGLYSKAFGCHLDEMADPDLKHYDNLGAFFYRELKAGARPIDETSKLVSPADGRVLHFGRVVNDQVEQIKGVTYSLDALLGQRSSSAEQTKDEAVSLRPEHDWTKIRPGNDLFFCVIYLAPGDYHRFHSPADWIVDTRRHFVGELYSVSPWMVEHLKNLFVLNERITLLGSWSHGFFSMVPVGATNVGSICINYEKGLQTNQFSTPLGTYAERLYEPQHVAKKGEELGGFRLGSTVVLVFEAPKQFEFAVSNDEKTPAFEPTLVVLHTHVLSLQILSTSFAMGVHSIPVTSSDSKPDDSQHQPAAEDVSMPQAEESPQDIWESSGSSSSSDSDPDSNLRGYDLQRKIESKRAKIERKRVKLNAKLEKLRAIEESLGSSAPKSAADSDKPRESPSLIDAGERLGNELDRLVRGLYEAVAARPELGEQFTKVLSQDALAAEEDTSTAAGAVVVAAAEEDSTTDSLVTLIPAATPDAPLVKIPAVPLVPKILEVRLVPKILAVPLVLKTPVAPSALAVLMALMALMATTIPLAIAATTVPLATTPIMAIMVIMRETRAAFKEFKRSFKEAQRDYRRAAKQGEDGQQIPPETQQEFEKLTREVEQDLNGLENDLRQVERDLEHIGGQPTVVSFADQTQSPVSAQETYQEALRLQRLRFEQLYQKSSEPHAVATPPLQDPVETRPRPASGIAIQIISSPSPAIDLESLTIPEIPAVPAVPAVPTIPAAPVVPPVSGVPVVPAVPAVPAVSAVPAPPAVHFQVAEPNFKAGLIDIPTIPSVPAVPAIPAVPDKAQIFYATDATSDISNEDTVLVNRAEVVFEQQAQALLAMGFQDDEFNRKLLTLLAGDINRCIEILSQP
ncbi:phosphatidylserine decarboxylase-domain-containing protein [Polychytrium aggregatum]|uniref:phosphatidylserine decarboxylase-domain-containing protein n=1 Tax=Polychytrium aggregatum TaxID=110093 RepID=UPI0022FDB3A4|nr:phosphatidylserine decarboxylase-domain-containing protein [Polychytrium aggregatum]KAI9205021.1 phosphatidylserine decarboxylase-domain-containing protein [Polychytrium aggregatum]